VILAAASDSSGVIIAAIGGATTIVSGLGVALIQISRLSRKADVVQAQTGELKVQMNGQMTALMTRLDKAEEGRRAAEVELAALKERYREHP